MDYVYTCRSGDNEELRYSIRSVLKNAPRGQIWLVGGKPDWYLGNFIEVKPKGNAIENVRTSLRKITESENISEEFVLMNDDFFIMNEVESIDYFYSGTLRDKILTRRSMFRNSLYVNYLDKSYTSISRKGIKEPLDYELHLPMRMEKKKLGEVLDLPGLWRSNYGNIYSVGGTQKADVKIYNNYTFLHEHLDQDNSTHLSTEDLSFKVLLPRLEKEFPDISPYEMS